MLLRGHTQADAARAMGTSEANISRWLNHPSKVPDLRTDESATNVYRIVDYLRLKSIYEYGALAFNSALEESKKRQGL